MATLFEALAASESNNLVRLDVERSALARDQSLFDLRDRFASTYSFEEALARTGDPIQALQQAQGAGTLGSFRDLFGTSLAVQGGQLGLQQQQRNLNTNDRFADVIISRLLGGISNNNQNNNSGVDLSGAPIFDNGTATVAKQPGAGNTATPIFN